MRCYDAIGLMRHLSEDTAATYANALDVLTNDDPEMPSKTFCSSDKNLSDPDNCFLHNNQENMPPVFLVRNISKECSVRVRVRVRVCVWAPLFTISNSFVALLL